MRRFGMGYGALYPFLFAAAVLVGGCDDGVSGIWEGSITTTEGVVDRYGSRTETETLPFSVKLEPDNGTLDGIVKWGTLDMDDPASVLGGDPIAYGTIMDDGYVTFSANTSTAAAPAMGYYNGTIEGETLTGTLRCTGEGVGKKAILIGKFTVNRK